jgi:para-nitrobenzyl esterase
MNNATVEITRGRLRGQSADGVIAFKGIPYAAPPVGHRRFMAPEPFPPWWGTRDALGFGYRAMQPESAFGLPSELVDMMGRPVEAIEENCLFLNVWTPSVTDGEKRPVMVWLHGGAFIAGSGSSRISEGTRLCRHGDVVVVTLNHRLGAFGFLHLAELGGAAYADSGIAGMLDIVAALEWVRDNIAAFGGDAANVTIFGESGGGAKVSVLMAMPAAKGLFHRAIIQSGPAVEMMPPEAATDVAAKVLHELSIAPGSLDRLRDVPAEQLLATQQAVLAANPGSFANRRRMGFNPVLGGRHLPSGPFEPTAPALSADIPLMIGTNKDEMALFLAFSPLLASATEDNVAELARSFVGDRAERIVDAYRRARPNDTARDLLVAITTDQAMRLPSLVMAERKVAQAAAPVFVYLFTFETPVMDGRLKSCHALEIPFVFDTIEAAPITGPGPGRQDLANAMSTTWIQFARAGDPNHRGLPSWPAYDLHTRPTLVFDRAVRLESDPQAAERKAWDLPVADAPALQAVEAR